MIMVETRTIAVMAATGTTLPDASFKE
jgi:hypothetical protein